MRPARTGAPSPPSNRASALRWSRSTKPKRSPSVTTNKVIEMVIHCSLNLYLPCTSPSPSPKTSTESSP